jgi:hypothetical protein
MATYNYTKVVNTAKLESELMAAVPYYLGLTTVDDNITVHTSQDLTSGALTILDTLIAMHVVSDTNLLKNINGIQPVIISEAPTYAADEIINSYFKENFVITTTTDVGPYVKSVSWPYPIAILGGHLTTKEAWEGDSFTVLMAPNTLVGQLVLQVSSGSKTITVDPACAEYYIWKGDSLKITDGASTTVDMGRIISKSGSTITMENAAPANLPSGMGILVTTTLVPHYEVCGAEEILIGRKTNRASYVPANIPLVVTYTNTSGIAKKVRFALEWYA